MALSGNELLQVQGITSSGLPSGQTFQTNTQAIADLFGTVPDQFVTALNTVGAGTLTATGMTGGFISRGGAQLSAPFTDTTDTANNIIAAISGAIVTDSFLFTYQNLTNAVATISGGSGVTVSVFTVIPPNSFGTYLVTYTATSTVTAAGVYQGFYPHSGVFTVAGTGTVTISDANITTASAIDITLKAVGGTVGSPPVIKTITTGTGFTVSATTGDVSVYNYTING